MAFVPTFWVRVREWVSPDICRQPHSAWCTVGSWRLIKLLMERSWANGRVQRGADFHLNKKPNFSSEELTREATAWKGCWESPKVPGMFLPHWPPGGISDLIQPLGLTRSTTSLLGMSRALLDTDRIRMKIESFRKVGITWSHCYNKTPWVWYTYMFINTFLRGLVKCSPNW